MAIPTFTMRQLLEAGVHFGHNTRRWNPKMQSYIFGVRNGIHIIDLEQSRREYHRFKAILSRFAEVLEVRDLLESIVDRPEVRMFLVERVTDVARSEPLAEQLLGLEASELVRLFIEGREVEKGPLQGVLNADQHDLPPLPNLFFTRDAAMVVNSALAASKGEQVKVGAMVTLRIGSLQTVCRVVGIAREPFAHATAYIPLAYFEQKAGHVGLVNNVRLVLDKTDSASVNRVKADLDRNLGREGVRAHSSSSKAESRFSFDQHMLMIYVFLIVMAIIIGGVGGLGLMTTMSLNVLERRREMVATLDRFSQQVESSPATASRDRFYEQAYRLLTSPAAKSAFDLSKESNAVRELYGRNRLGSSCLLARRLVEAGARFVTVVDRGWDTHSQTFNAHKTRLLPQLDTVLSALIGDLSERGMLDSTVVYCAGGYRSSIAASPALMTCSTSVSPGVTVITWLRRVVSSP